MANPNAHIHVQFLTHMTVLVGNLGFLSITDQYETPCKIQALNFSFKKGSGLRIWRILFAGNKMLFIKRNTLVSWFSKRKCRPYSNWPKIALSGIFFSWDCITPHWFFVSRWRLPACRSNKVRLVIESNRKCK